MELTEKQCLGFKEIEKLKNDWDSYGATPFEKKVIKKAEALCGFLGEECEIEPQNDGSIDLYCRGMVYTIAIDDYTQKNED